MPESETLAKAHRDKEQGKSPSTQAGEFIREEFHHIREGKHGARSAQQAIAIGLSKARRAGVDLKLPKSKVANEKTRKQAARDLAKGRSRRPRSPRRSRATLSALQREGHSAGSKAAISRQMHQAAKRRGRASLHAAAMKAVRTKGSSGLRRAAKKAARTRQRHG